MEVLQIDLTRVLKKKTFNPYSKRSVQLHSVKHDHSGL